MKLKTQMEGPHPTVNVEICGVLGTTRIHGDDERHDIAAAHALVQVMERHKEAYGFDADSFYDDAENLMRQWGYPNTEYPPNSRIEGNGEVPNVGS